MQFCAQQLEPKVITEAGKSMLTPLIFDYCSADNDNI